MEERQNRFILFPLDEDEGSSENDGISAKNDETVQNDTVDLKDVELSNQDNGDFQELDSQLVDPVAVDSEDQHLKTTEISDDLGDLGVIQRDSNGRIIFDANLDDPVLNFESSIENDDPSLDLEESSSLKDDPVFSDNFDEEEEISEIGDASVGQSVNAFQQNRSLQDMINQILKIDHLEPVKVTVSEETPEKIEEKNRYEEEYKQKINRENQFRQEIYDVINHDNRPVVFKSNLLEQLRQESVSNNQLSMLVRYGEDYCSKDFVTNPAIGREREIRELILTLLTPEKSAILIGKPGIGKTSIVEGLAYRLQRGDVPEALQGFSIVNIKTPSLIGTLSNGETRLQSLVDELKKLDHVILFIDEIHMLIGATNDSAMDFANMFKEGLGRGQIKIVGATTTEEYERYILRDKAFVRRFQSIEVLEPSREHTIKILMGTLPKIEKDTGAKLKYTTFIQTEIMGFITDITSEYKRVYGIGSRYPDICLTLLKEAFSQCIFDNRDRVTIFDIRNAIQNSKNIYPDVIRKELPKFDEMFKKIMDEEIADDASIDRL